jgi:hypothetical protein
LGKAVAALGNIAIMDYQKRVSMPLPNETAAVAACPKTAALCFDRVWDATRDVVPDGIRFRGMTEIEQALVALSAMGLPEIPYELDPSTDPRMQRIQQVFGGLENYSDADTADALEQGMLRRLASQYWGNYRRTIVPVYNSVAVRNTHYKEAAAGRACLVLALENLQIVDESALTWEQVREFRSDKKSAARYRRFVHWMDKEFVGRSQSFVEYEIEQALQQYEDSLRKHGIKTVLGLVSETIDGTYLTGASAVAATLAALGHPAAGLIAGGGVLVVRLGVKASEIVLDIDEAEKGPGSEVAWVYEVREELKQPRSR